LARWSALGSRPRVALSSATVLGISAFAVIFFNKGSIFVFIFPCSRPLDFRLHNSGNPGEWNNRKPRRSPFTSFPRRRESILRARASLRGGLCHASSVPPCSSFPSATWIPAFAGMTRLRHCRQKAWRQRRKIDVGVPAKRRHSREISFQFSVFSFQFCAKRIARGGVTRHFPRRRESK
jgi:hypothetical protein